MISARKTDKDPIATRLHTMVLVVCWSVVIIVSLFWNIHQLKLSTFSVARTQAEIGFEKDIVYRQWAAAHGGVYVPMTEKAKPNPYLDVPNRNITAPSGRQLTLMNPAYMSRQIYELGEQKYGVHGHITSLRPNRPENAPDPWETQALKAFEQGKKEIYSIEDFHGESYLRLMRPVIAEKDCLKCHGSQGYKEGDIRGGISVSIPMAPLWAIERHHMLSLIIGHGLFWLIGLIGIGLAIHHLNRQGDRRKEAERITKDSEVKFRTLYESTSDAVMLLDEKGFFDCNESTLRIFGYSTREEFCGKHPGEVSPPTQPAGEDSIEAANERIAEAFRAGRNFFEWMHRRADGEDFPAEVLLTPMELKGRQVFQATVRDITEHRQLEDQLRRAQKMEAIGQLTGGIAHDFNNLLTGILGYITFAQNQTAEEDPIHQDLEEARRCAERASSLTSRLLAFGRKQPLKTATEDLNVIVRESTGMLKRILGEHIELQLGLAPERITLRVDQSQIEQVIINICVNGRDAMPRGGTLLLQTSNMTADKAFCASHPDLRPGRYAVLRITDNGTGMDEETIERIFDPFFTTKEVGKGTGLGLSMAYGIMRQHKGQIYVRSKPGEGSTFELYFPAAQAESGHGGKIEGKAEVLQNGNGS